MSVPYAVVIKRARDEDVVVAPFKCRASARAWAELAVPAPMRWRIAIHVAPS